MKAVGTAVLLDPVYYLPIPRQRMYIRPEDSRLPSRVGWRKSAV